MHRPWTHSSTAALPARSGVARSCESPRRQVHEDYGGISTSRWDSLSRDAGIVKGAGQWQRRLASVRTEGDSEDGEVPEWVKQRSDDAKRRARFMAELDQRLRGRPARATWAGHLDYLQGRPASACRRAPCRVRGTRLRCHS